MGTTYTSPSSAVQQTLNGISTRSRSLSGASPAKEEGKEVEKKEKSCTTKMKTNDAKTLQEAIFAKAEMKWVQLSST